MLAEPASLDTLPRHRNPSVWIGLSMTLLVVPVSPCGVWGDGKSGDDRTGHDEPELIEPRADLPVAVLRPVEEDRSVKDDRERMVTWHRRNRQVMESVERRWLGALKANDRILWKDPAPACTELLKVLESTGVGGLLKAPDPVVRIHLGRSLDRLRAAAGACARGRYFESTHLFHEAARAFLEARVFLLRYGLSP